MSGVLHGVTVIDMTTVVFGPYATQLLAGMGADVIKVEAPGGDVFRRAGKPARTPGMGPAHMVLNRGKRSALLDLKTEQDRALLHAMLARADIFIHNVRERAIERLGFGHTDLRARHKRLITVHCRGFGKGGPYSDLAAYDDAVQAGSGLTSFLPRADGNPQPRYIPTTIADKVAGLHAAYAAIAALYHRERTGEAQHVDVPMFECFTHFLYQEHLWGEAFDPPTAPAGYSRQFDPHRQPFPTSDGHIAVVPYNDAQWCRTLELLGGADRLRKPPLATPESRAASIPALNAAIAELAPAFTTADLLQRFAEAGIAAMAARDHRTIKQDPHLAATNFFRREPHPSEGNVVAMRTPVDFGACPEPAMRPAPRLGEHTEDLRKEFQQ